MSSLRVVAIAVTIILGMMGGIKLAGPETLGITPVTARWLDIIAIGLGMGAGFLPRVTGPTTDPDALADRVSSLPPRDQKQIVSTVVADASASDDMDAVPLLAGAVGSLSVQDRDRLVRLLETRSGLVTRPPERVPPHPMGRPMNERG